MWDASTSRLVKLAKSCLEQITPTASSYKLASGGSAGCNATLPVGVKLRRRDALDVKPAEVGDLGDLEGRGVVYDVEGCSVSSFFLVNRRGVK